MKNSFFHQIYHHLCAVLWHSGWTAIAAFHEENAEYELKCLEKMKGLRVDAIFMCPCDLKQNAWYIKKLINKGFKFVFLDNIPQLSNITFIDIDHENSIFSIVQSLIEQGYKRIAILNPPDNKHYSAARLKGYRAAVTRHGLLDETLIFKSRGMEFENGVAFADKIKNRISDIDAIVACDDYVALGIISRLQESGIRVPEDVAVTGFGGSDICKMVTPKITTVELPTEEIGRWAGELILKQIKQPNSCKGTSICLKTEIKYRDSTKKAGKKRKARNQ